MRVARFVSRVSVSGFFRPRKKDAGPAVRAASHMREEVKVTGSMLSMPTRWATNAVPQMMAVMSRRILPSIFLFFMESRLWK